MRPFNGQQAVLQITQPVVRGTLWPALQAARYQLDQAQAALSQAQFEAVQHLVVAVFELLKARDALNFVHAQQVSSGEQLTVARRAHQVGTAPLTDVRDAEARADAVAAQTIAAGAELTLRQQTLTELAGAGTETLLARSLDGQRLPVLDPASMLVWPSMCSRAAASTRSMVAALTCKTLVLMTGSKSRWPCRSMASTNIGISAFRRLPQTRSAASHSTVNAWRTASS